MCFKKKKYFEVVSSFMFSLLRFHNQLCRTKINVDGNINAKDNLIALSGAQICTSHGHQHKKNMITQSWLFPHSLVYSLTDDMGTDNKLKVSTVKLTKHEFTVTIYHSVQDKNKLYSSTVSQFVTS